MRTIGLIGGMSWESTALYYRIINREVARRLGGLRSASLLMSSLDFEEVVARQKAGAWGELAALLGGAAARLERAGAECLLIGTNTMHRVAPEVEAAISVPLLHIADAAVAALSAAGCRRVALLGTRYTMEQPFYAAHLARHGIDCVVPDAADRAEVHRVIFEELCKGDFDAGSRRRLAGIVARQVERGAGGVLLACTELTLSLRQEDVAVPLFDTTALHALAAVDFALAAGPQAAPTWRRTAAASCAELTGLVM
jgi:aspartate racemase